MAQARKKKATKKAAPRKEAAGVAEGAKAPSFALPDQDGELASSKDLGGSPYVLFFYPRANTPGCTRETCDFRDAHAKFKRAGVKVLGVSPDTTTKQAKFHAQHEVVFPLLCDTEKELATAYGCYKEKSMYGRKVMGIERSTFLVDGKGRLAKAWRKVRVPGHVDEVLSAAKEL